MQRFRIDNEVKNGLSLGVLILRDESNTLRDNLLVDKY